MILLIMLLLAGQYIVATQNRIKIKESPIDLIYAPVRLFDKSPCSWMKYMKHQYRLCKRDLMLSEVLLTARKLAIFDCEEQFRFDRWNCSRKKSVFKRVHRETALLYAMAASAITFSVARACSEGHLKSCQCGKDPHQKNQIENWRWGGCSDNIAYAKKFTRRFLQLHRTGSYYPNDILRHNSEVGLQTITDSYRKACRCHGVLGSCTRKICWKQIDPFKNIAKKLKTRYYEAVRLSSGNKSKSRLKMKGRKDQLYYLARSSTFCEATVGRRCLDASNCAILCCTRGYDTKVGSYREPCNCRWQERFDLKCDNCTFSRDEYYCKP